MKIFSFVKKVFVLELTVLSNITNALECVSIKNQECKLRPKTVDINSNNPIFCPFSVKIVVIVIILMIHMQKICVPDIVRNLNVKVFNVISLTNETRSIKWHESCKCICRLNKVICNNKQKWTKKNVDVNVRIN